MTGGRTFPWDSLRSAFRHTPCPWVYRLVVPYPSFMSFPLRPDSGQRVFRCEAGVAFGNVEEFPG